MPKQNTIIIGSQLFAAALYLSSCLSSQEKALEEGAHLTPTDSLGGTTTSPGVASGTTPPAAVPPSPTPPAAVLPSPTPPAGAPGPSTSGPKPAVTAAEPLSDTFSLTAKAKIKGSKAKRKSKPQAPRKAPAPKPTPPPLVKSSPPPVPPVVEASHHYLGLRALVSSFGSGMGIEYIYQPWTYFDFGLSAAGTQASFDRESATKTTESLKGQQVNFRGFVRFSYYRLIYLGFGLGVSSISGSYGFEGTGVASGSIESDYTAQYLVPELFFGSEWTLGESFYFGVDWASFAAPTETSLNVSSNENLDLTSELLTGAKAETRISEEIMAQLKLSFIMFRGGYRF